MQLILVFGGHRWRHGDGAVGALGNGPHTYRTPLARPGGG